jgi:hypothetical protein
MPNAYCTPKIVTVSTLLEDSAAGLGALSDLYCLHTCYPFNNYDRPMSPGLNDCIYIVRYCGGPAVPFRLY